MKMQTTLSESLNLRIKFFISFKISLHSVKTQQKLVIKT